MMVVLIFPYMGCQSIGPRVSCLFVCVKSNQITSKKPCHLCQISVTSMSCCIKHTGGEVDGVEGGGGGLTKFDEGVYTVIIPSTNCVSF